MSESVVLPDSSEIGRRLAGVPMGSGASFVTVHLQENAAGSELSGVGVVVVVTSALLAAHRLDEATPLPDGVSYGESLPFEELRVAILTALIDDQAALRDALAFLDRLD
jgi:hypothetical protein